MIRLLLAVLVSPAAAAPATAEFALATSTYTVATLYSGDLVRDPFMPPSAGSSRPRRAERGEEDEEQELDIHALRLNGILKDRTADYAIFATKAGEMLILRAGALYDQRRKRVPGATGRIEVRQKRVTLTGADGDVQRYVLGERAPE